LQEEEQLQLLFGESPYRGHQHGYIRVDLPFDHGRRVAVGFFQVAAIFRAGNLCQTLRGATDGANLFIARRARAFDRTFSAYRTSHKS
jgi:hypothetical protein